MDPLQLLMFRMTERWNNSAAQGSWLSIILVSCLIPFLLNLVSSQVRRLQRVIADRLRRYEYVIVRQDRKSSRNDLYRYVSMFLDSQAESGGASKNAKIFAPLMDTLVFGLEPGQPVTDTFEGVPVRWDFVKTESKGDSTSSDQYYMLRMRKEHRHMQRRYLLHIAKTVQQLEQEDKTRNLFTFTGVGGDSYWESYVFKHPSTFESLAMDPELKARIKNDLNEFVASQEYYQSVGKPWKRGYLLYGPPGTGKSSLIAAVANYLSFDVYDLDLSGVRSNADLRNLLLQTRNKSVIVIEDIDCCFSTTLEARRSRGKMETKKDGEEEGVTLSGMLNFCDGLWSGKGDERVFIFTTNYLENLDPALLRKGRMDLHICMSYCRFEGMKTLVANYVKVEDEQPELMREIEMLLEEVNVTPADVAEVLLSSRKNPAAALENVISLLKERKDRNPEEDEDEDAGGAGKVRKGGPLAGSSGPPRGTRKYGSRGRYHPPRYHDAPYLD